MNADITIEALLDVGIIHVPVLTGCTANHSDRVLCLELRSTGLEGPLTHRVELVLRADSQVCFQRDSERDAVAVATFLAEDFGTWFDSNLPTTELLRNAKIGGEWQLLSVLQGFLVVARRRCHELT